MKILKRGGVRLGFERGSIVVYVDADKLAAVHEVDTPEIAVARFSWKDVVAEARRAWKRVKKAVRK